MMPKNIFKIYDGRTHFWQWDRGQKLIVQASDISELHFSNKIMTEAIRSDVYKQDDLYLCNIPDLILEAAHDLTVYACVIGEDFSKTTYCAKFSVFSKEKPSDWIGEGELLPSDWFATISYVDNKIADIQFSGGGITKNEVQDMIDALDNKIGDVEEGKTVVEMIADAVYDDSEITTKITNLEELVGNNKVSEQINNIDTKVNEVSTLVGDTSVSDQIDEALLNSQADWDQTDSTKPDYIKNKPDENDALELVSEMGLAEPVFAEDGSVYTDKNGVLYTL